MLINIDGGLIYLRFYKDCRNEIVISFEKRHAGDTLANKEDYVQLHPGESVFRNIINTTTGV